MLHEKWLTVIKIKGVKNKGFDRRKNKEDSFIGGNGDLIGSNPFQIFHNMEKEKNNESMDLTGEKIKGSLMALKVKLVAMNNQGVLPTKT